MHRILRPHKSGGAPALAAADVHASRGGWAGLPPCADAVAFDADARMLALATSDGRVAVAAAACPETGLPPPAGPPAASDARVATAALVPLPGRGQLLRLTAGGDVQLWGAPGCGGPAGDGDGDAGGLVDALPLADAATAAAPLPSEPFILLGRASGAVSMLVLTRGERAAGNEAAADPVDGPAAPAGGMSLAPYEIPASATGAGAVTALLPPSSPPSSVIAIAHERSGVTLWDVRRETGVARAFRGDSEVETTAAAWASPAGALLATGHADGAVCLWRVPAQPPRRRGGGGAAALNLAPCVTLALAAAGGGAPTPVRGLWLAAPDALLAWGGRGGDEPVELTVVDPAAEARTGAAGGAASEPTHAPTARSLPWFGPLRGVALLPPSSPPSPSSPPTCRALALAAGGALTAYSLRDGAPAPLAPPLAALPPATAAALAAAPPDSARRAGHDTALLHACTPAAAAAAARARAEAAAAECGRLRAEVAALRSTATLQVGHINLLLRLSGALVRGGAAVAAADRLPRGGSLP